MKQTLTIVLLFLLFSCNSDHNSNAPKAIMQVLNKQCNAWNNGNIENYMQGYWNNDSLLFIGSNGPNYGYNTTLKRYQKAYPTKEKMGSLSFSEINMKQLSQDTYFVTGRWKLKRIPDDLSGYFTLIVRQFDDGWKIIADHSS